MTTYKIGAPDPKFNGVVADVIFNQGVGQLTVSENTDRVEGATNLPKPNAALAYFRRKGYAIEELSPSKADEEPADEPEVPKLPAKSASKADWVKYATEHGGMTAEEANAMTANALAAKFLEEDPK